MKLLLALLLTIASFGTSAATIATMQNDAGGVTVLTSSHSSTCTGVMYVAFANSKGGGRTLFGCWSFADDFVFITWADRTTSSYPLSDFTLTEPAP